MAELRDLTTWLAARKADHEKHEVRYSGGVAVDECALCVEPWPCPDMRRFAVIEAAARQEHLADVGLSTLHRYGENIPARAPCSLCAALTRLVEAE